MMKNNGLKIALIPLDNRPVSYVLPQQVCAISNNLNIFVPPRDLIGGLFDGTKILDVLNWLESTLEKEKPEILVLCLDTIAYGGLVQSRRAPLTKSEIANNLKKLKNLIKKFNVKTYAFSSIMRISNNNVNEEEKLYWDKYGTLIFKYSYLADCEQRLRGESDELSTGTPFSASNQGTDCEQRLKGGSHELSTGTPFSANNQGADCELETVKKQIPDEILSDYLETRKRNFEINKIYFDWAQDGTLDYLVFSQDDTAQYGLNVQEGELLQAEIISKNLQDKVIIKTGADEIPCDLVSLAVTKAENTTVKIYPLFANPQSVDLISRYENISVEKSVESQIELCGGTVVASESEADIVLFVNNFLKEQGYHAMQLKTEVIVPEIQPQILEKPFAIADIVNANGCDDEFVKKLLEKNLEKLYGFGGWNTTGNTLGGCITTAIMKYIAIKENFFNEEAFKKAIITRFLDDWAYQTVVRQIIRKQTSKADLEILNREMQPFAKIIGKKFNIESSTLKYSFPWDRTFEVEVDI